MGCRNIANICEKVTTTISLNMFKIGNLVVDYLDDLLELRLKIM